MSSNDPSSPAETGPASVSLTRWQRFRLVVKVVELRLRFVALMAATALVAQHPHPDEHTVREQLDGNLCRCTGYHNIVRAVMHGAEAMAEAEGDDASLQSLAAARAHAA